ncbi:MAG: hypothetical protein P8012_13150 [Desulfobacterales bacterium]
MQKDFHYCLIKVLTQKSGFSPEDAQIIAYASQYTDDAVEYLPLRIKNLPDLDFKKRVDGEYFDPICTAHRGIEYITGIFKDVQRKVYISFHFLPSLKYEGAGRYNYCCVPDGSLARLLIQQASDKINTVKKEKRTRKLIQLGIALHTYADNWSHQRFSGRRSARDNDVERIHIFKGNDFEPLPFFDQLKLNILPDVGHAETFNLPDLSHLRWKYEHDESGFEYVRDNMTIFLEAAFAIFKVLCGANKQSDNWKSLVNKIKECFSIPSDSIKRKFQKYTELFPEITFNYSEDDWRNQALKGESFDWINFEKEDYKAQTYKFNGDMKWFYFHMAAYDQRLFAIKNIREDLL